MRRLIEREAASLVRSAEDLRSQWQAVQAARVAQQAATDRLRRAWELGEAGLSDWLLASRNDGQARRAEAVARVDALEAGLRVRVDSHELWHPELPMEAHSHSHAAPPSSR